MGRNDDWVDLPPPEGAELFHWNDSLVRVRGQVLGRVSCRQCGHQVWIPHSLGGGPSQAWEPDLRYVCEECGGDPWEFVGPEGNETLVEWWTRTVAMALRRHAEEILRARSEP